MEGPERLAALERRTGIVRGESRRLLDRLREQAPAEFRDTLFDDVPPHREILKAGREGRPRAGRFGLVWK